MKNRIILTISYKTNRGSKEETICHILIIAPCAQITDTLLINIRQIILEVELIKDQLHLSLVQLILPFLLLPPLLLPQLLLKTMILLQAALQLQALHLQGTLPQTQILHLIEILSLKIKMLHQRLAPLALSLRSMALLLMTLMSLTPQAQKILGCLHSLVFHMKAIAQVMKAQFLQALVKKLKQRKHQEGRISQYLVLLL